MHRDDLLTQVRIRARLHGRKHARRTDTIGKQTRQPGRAKNAP